MIYMASEKYKEDKKICGILVAIFPIIWIRDFRFFFLNETYQAFLLFPIRKEKQNCH